MAWISVHDHVAGGKLRELAKDIGCSQKETLGILVSLWLWGLNNADRDGRLRSCERDDISEELSKGITESLDPDGIVQSLIEKGWIDEGDDGTLYLHDWDVWQEQWYKFLSAKEYDAKRKRQERARKRAKEEEALDAAVERAKGAPKEKRPTDSPSDSPMDSPTDAAEEKPKKQRKATKKADKKQYAQYVALTDDEYGKLVDGYGQKAADQFVEELNLYKGSTGKSYKSDYMTILNWVVERVEKKYPGMIQRQVATGLPVTGGMAKPVTQNRNRFNNFQGRQYDYEALERELLAAQSKRKEAASGSA